MSDTVWLHVDGHALINTAHITCIAASTEEDQVCVSVWFANPANLTITIAKLKTLKAATKFMSSLSKLIKQGVKCIDTRMIAEQADNDSN